MADSAANVRDVMERVRAAWKRAEALAVDDPFARRGMAGLSSALREAADYIDDHRWTEAKS